MTHADQGPLTPGPGGVSPAHDQGPPGPTTRRVGPGLSRGTRSIRPTSSTTTTGHESTREQVDQQRRQPPVVETGPTTEWDWPAIHEAEANARERFADRRRCVICNRPMVLGQPSVPEARNLAGAAHYVCTGQLVAAAAEGTGGLS